VLLAAVNTARRAEPSAIGNKCTALAAMSRGLPDEDPLEPPHAMEDTELRGHSGPPSETTTKRRTPDDSQGVRRFVVYGVSYGC
jgi:hypothetical protein